MEAHTEFPGFQSREDRFSSSRRTRKTRLQVLPHESCFLERGHEVLRLPCGPSSRAVWSSLRGMSHGPGLACLDPGRERPSEPFPAPRRSCCSRLRLLSHKRSRRPVHRPAHRLRLLPHDRLFKHRQRNRSQSLELPHNLRIVSQL